MPARRSSCSARWIACRQPCAGKGGEILSPWAGSHSHTGSVSPDSEISPERIGYEPKSAALVGQRVLGVRYWDVRNFGAELRDWDYGDWHHAVMGVDLLTDRGPMCVLWTNTFHPAKTAGQRLRASLARHRQVILDVNGVGLSTSPACGRSDRTGHQAAGVARVSSSRHGRWRTRLPRSGDPRGCARPIPVS